MALVALTTIGATVCTNSPTPCAFDAGVKRSTWGDSLCRDYLQNQPRHGLATQGRSGREIQVFDLIEIFVFSIFGSIRAFDVSRKSNAMCAGAQTSTSYSSQFIQPTCFGPAQNNRKGHPVMIRSIALAALATLSFGSQAALVTYAPWDAALPGIAGVMFNVVSVDGITVAIGAHAYKNSVNLANNGADIYDAQSGLYAPDGKNYANWSFDFAWDLGGCASCKVILKVDTDPTADVNLMTLFDTSVSGAIPALFGSGATTVPNAYFQSWNMEMGFINTALGGYNFNPFSASSTAFELQVVNSRTTGVVGAGSVSAGVTVNVPEPGSLALVGLGLLGLAGLRRRKT